MTEPKDCNGYTRGKGMNQPRCQTCRWWMYEDEQMEWEHASAVQQNKGFCVLEDLFTYTEPSHVCGEYCKE